MSFYTYEKALDHGGKGPPKFCRRCGGKLKVQFERTFDEYTGEQVREVQLLSCVPCSGRAWL